MSKQTNEESIHQLFTICCDSKLHATFQSICKIWWIVLGNSLTICDLFGIFIQVLSDSSSTSASSLSSVGRDDEDKLDRSLFVRFFHSAASMKYSNQHDSKELLIQDFYYAKRLQPRLHSSSFTKIFTRDIMKLCLQCDAQLRQLYCTYVGKNVRLTSTVTWKEIVQESLGLELDQFQSFAEEFRIIPDILSVSEFDTKCREVLDQYPLILSTSSSAIFYYPQFQITLLLLCLFILEKKDQSSYGFAKKVTIIESKELVDTIRFFFENLGLSKEMKAESKSLKDRVGNKDKKDEKHESNVESFIETNLDNSIVISPFSNRVDIIHGHTSASSSVVASSSNHARETYLLKLDKHFDRIINLLVKHSYQQFVDNAINLFMHSEILSRKNRIFNNPVVVFDAVSFPKYLPESLEQLIQQSWSNYNDGNLQGSLQNLNLASRMTDEAFDKMEAWEVKLKESSYSSLKLSPKHDFSIYVQISKSNLYQSYGEDDQALTENITAFTTALDLGDSDWAMVALNSIGIIAYYNLRFDVAMACFSIVIDYREQAYGKESADLATAVNNYGSCLFCIEKGGEARAYFERALALSSSVLGPNASRTVAYRDNFDKSRRFISVLAHDDEKLYRTESSMLLNGGTFIIKALPPPPKPKLMRKVIKGKKKK